MPGSARPADASSILSSTDRSAADRPTPVSPWQGRSTARRSLATPSWIRSGGVEAKHSRRASVNRPDGENADPGMNATPSASAGSKSAVVSTPLSRVTQQKKPPSGSVHRRESPKCSRSAACIASLRRRYTARWVTRWSSRCPPVRKPDQQPLRGQVRARVHRLLRVDQKRLQLGNGVDPADPQPRRDDLREGADREHQRVAAPQLAQRRQRLAREPQQTVGVVVDHHRPPLTWPARGAAAGAPTTA